MWPLKAQGMPGHRIPPKKWSKSRPLKGALGFFLNKVPVKGSSKGALGVLQQGTLGHR